jgi:hypothetical protein
VVILDRVWVPKTLSPLCDLGVFTDQAAEPVSPQHPDVRACCGRIRASGGWVLLERPVETMSATVTGLSVPTGYTERDIHRIAQLEGSRPWSGNCQYPARRPARRGRSRRLHLKRAAGWRPAPVRVSAAAQQTLERLLAEALRLDRLPGVREVHGRYTQHGCCPAVIVGSQRRWHGRLL